MRGRKPTPTALKLMRGNPGKRAINPDEPRPPSARPDPPEDLVADARAACAATCGKCPACRAAAAARVALDEWIVRAEQLDALGVLTELDLPAFLAYCRAWGRYVEAESRIADLGEVVRAPSGYPIPNPYRAVANRALQQCQQFWSEFGMMPSSRTRIGAKPRKGKGARAARRERFFGGLSRRA